MVGRSGPRIDSPLDTAEPRIISRRSERMAPSTTHLPYISSRAAALQGNSLAELFLLARQRGAIDLALGTPGYPEPATEIIEAAYEAMRAGRNQYEHPSGDL